MKRSKEKIREDYARQLREGVKFCSKCEEWKPLKYYSKLQGRYDGLMANCHQCRAKTNKARLKRIGFMYPNKPQWAIDLEANIKPH